MREISLVQKQLCWLAPIRIQWWRLVFEYETLPGSFEEGDLSTLRGVWGKVLHEQNPALYRQVFEGVGDASSSQPLYSLRPDVDATGVLWKNPKGTFSVQWGLWNVSEEDTLALLNLWPTVGTLGIGGRRQKFRLVCANVLTESLVNWPLADLSNGCHLVFSQSLRLMRREKPLEKPTLRDIVEATLHRLSSLATITASEDLDALVFPKHRTQLWPPFAEELLELAERIPQTPWHGIPRTFRRYSGRQEREVGLKGVAGALSLPQGPGQLWPLIAAAGTVHIGKGSVFGLGRPFLLPME